MPSQANIDKMWAYARKYAEKSGTSLHPDVNVTQTVVEGLARHIESGTPVAVKYLIKSSAVVPAFTGAFANEARILSTLRSPNVTALYEYVE